MQLCSSFKLSTFLKNECAQRPKVMDKIEVVNKLTDLHLTTNN